MQSPATLHAMPAVVIVDVEDVLVDDDVVVILEVVVSEAFEAV